MEMRTNSDVCPDLSAVRILLFQLTMVTVLNGGKQRGWNCHVQPVFGEWTSGSIFSYFTLPWTINQLKFISIHL